MYDDDLSSSMAEPAPEQGQAHRPQAVAAAGTRVVDPCEVATEGARATNQALFNLAIDSNLRGCDLVALRVDDVAPNGYVVDRASVRQGKTGRPVRFEVTEITRQSLDEHLRLDGRQPGQWTPRP
jgi:hypothetical protein